MTFRLGFALLALAAFAALPACGAGDSPPVTADTHAVAFTVVEGGLGEAPPAGSTCDGEGGASYSVDLRTSIATYSFCLESGVWQSETGSLALTASEVTTVRNALAAISPTDTSERGCEDCDEVYADISGDDTQRYYEAMADSPSDATTANGVQNALDVLAQIVLMHVAPDASTG